MTPQWGFRDEVPKSDVQAICKIENLGVTYVNDASEVKGAVKSLLEKHSDLHGLLLQSVSNWVPEGVSMVKASGRKDVWAATWNLDISYAKLLLEPEPVLWNVQSYSQYAEAGTAVVDAIAKWHLGYDLPMHVILPTVSITPKNVEEGWRKVYRDTADTEPPWLKYKGWV